VTSSALLAIFEKLQSCSQALHAGQLLFENTTNDFANFTEEKAKALASFIGTHIETLAQHATCRKLLSNLLSFNNMDQHFLKFSQHVLSPEVGRLVRGAVVPGDFFSSLLLHGGAPFEFDLENEISGVAFCRKMFDDNNSEVLKLVITASESLVAKRKCNEIQGELFSLRVQAAMNEYFVKAASLLGKANQLGLLVRSTKSPATLPTLLLTLTLFFVQRAFRANVEQIDAKEEREAHENAKKSLAKQTLAMSCLRWPHNNDNVFAETDELSAVNLLVKDELSIEAEAGTLFDIDQTLD
jgi:hypothetical protein